MTNDIKQIYYYNININKYNLIGNIAKLIFISISRSLSVIHIVIVIVIEIWIRLELSSLFNLKIVEIFHK